MCRASRSTPRAITSPRASASLEAIEAIREELVVRLADLRAANRLVEAQRLEQRTRFDLEMMTEIGHCKGIENYSRFLSGREAGEPPPTLFDYLPDDALLFIDESHVTVPQLGGMYRGDRSRKETLVEYGFRLPSALDNRPLRFRRVRTHGPADHLRVRHARAVRGAARGRGGGTGRAPDRTRGPARGGAPRVDAGR